MPSRLRALRSPVSGLFVLAALGGMSCLTGEGNPGIDPPADSFAFPAGVTLDPRASTAPTGSCEADADCGEGELCGSAGVCREPARWMFVTNANSDRRYNAGSLLTVDLDKYWGVLEDEDERVNGRANDATTALRLDLPTDSEPTAAQLRAAKTPDKLRDPDFPVCRRVANLPQAIECLESAFVEEQLTVHFGNFPGPMGSWNDDPSNDEAMLLIPVRGDPSITYIELSGAPDSPPTIECGQMGDAEVIDGLRCADDHRLRFFRNDEDGERLSREPFRVVVSPDPTRDLAYITHQGDPDLTLLDLQGTTGAQDGRPAIVHQAAILGLNTPRLDIQGGFGVAERPCDPDGAPNVTLACERPLVYSAMRWNKELRTFTTITNEPSAEQSCIGEDGVTDSVPGAIVCDPQVQPLRTIVVAGLSTSQVPLSTSRPVLADLGFSRSGDALFAVQSNPGGLLRFDTSIGDDGETVDVSAGQVEVCSQPTTLAIYDDGEVEYGVVSCYRSGEIFIVDLAQLVVVGLTRAGIGPDAVAVDLAREKLYVANTLDATLSVIEMDPRSSARFTQIARIGLQEPYVQ